jgi:hypothetical protein
MAEREVKADAPVADVPDAPFSAEEARGTDGDGALSPSDGVTVIPSMGPGPDSGWQSSRGSGQMSLDGEGQEFAANIGRDVTLAEHLTSQLNLNLRKPRWHGQ